MKTLLFCSILLITGCCHNPLCPPHGSQATKILRENPFEIRARGEVYVEEEY